MERLKPNEFAVARTCLLILNEQAIAQQSIELLDKAEGYAKEILDLEDRIVNLCERMVFDLTGKVIATSETDDNNL